MQTWYKTHFTNNFFMKNFIRYFLIIMAIAIPLMWLTSCKKIKIETSTTGDVNIYPYLAANPDQFSLWTKIIEKSGFAGFLTAYGSYTMFAPTDDAVKLYLTDVGKASIDNINETEAKDL